MKFSNPTVEFYQVDQAKEIIYMQKKIKMIGDLIYFAYKHKSVA